MRKYSLDITSKNKPFINIEVENDRVLLGAYEDGKIERKLFFIKKEKKKRRKLFFQNKQETGVDVYKKKTSRNYGGNL